MSLCGHAAIIWLAFSNLHFLAVSHDYTPPIRKERVLDLSAPVYTRTVRPTPDTVRSNTTSAQASKDARPALAHPEAPSEMMAAAPAPTGLPKFQMPPQVKQTPMATLVQLDLPPTVDLRPELRVPALAILAEANQRRIPKPFVAPPERKKTVEIPKDVALDLRPPIVEVRAGHAKTPEFLARVSPALPPPIGATAPLAGERQVTESKQAATVTGDLPSEPVTVISMPERPIPAASSIVLPALNQVGTMHAGSGQSGSGNGNSSNVEKANDERSGVQVPGIGKQAGTMVSLGSETQSSASRGEGRSGNSTGKSAGDRTTTLAVGNGGSGLNDATGTAGSGSPEGTAGMGPPSTIPSPVARVVRPREGNYEVAVVQSSGGVPGTAGLLNGRPVYSVYLSVGTQRDWILQYCLPKTEARSSAPSNTVQIGSVAPVSAPYVFLILRPSIHFRAGARYGFIHGFVNESGRLEQLTEAGESAIEDVATLVQKLAEWEFRPASKDGQPTRVEILLCIPAAGA